MRVSFKKFALGGAAFLALTLALPATPAFATNPTVCGNRTDLVKLQSAAGDICYVNGGVTAVNIPGVRQMYSGRNKVTINYELGGRYYSLPMTPGQRAIRPSVRVYEVRIW
jgi:hypothetical protein